MVTDLARTARIALILSLALTLGLACAPAAAPSPATTVAATAAPAVSTSPAPAASPVSPSPVAAAPATTAEATFDEQAVASFYRGKTIRLLVGYSPGGGNDLVARILARHMPKHLPGNPTIVVENKPGAATMLAINTLYNNEPKDGSVIANFNPQLLITQATGGSGVQFDASKMTWLGAATNEPILCVARTESGVSSLKDVIDGGKELILASTAPGSPPYDTPSVLNAVLGTHFKIVSGYAGSAEQATAVDKGEADGRCGVLDTGTLAWLDRGQGKVIVIMGDKTPAHPHLAGVPAAETLARNNDDLAILRVMNAPSRVLRAFVAPPDVPGDRAAALRLAMSRAFADPEFKAESDQSNFSLSPSTGPEVENVVTEVFRTPAPVLERLKGMLGS